MHKSRYKLYKQGKKWVIIAVAATSIGIGGYMLTSPNLAHAFDERFASVALQSVDNDGDFYKIADHLSMASKNGGNAESDYDSFKAALSAYEIAKETNATVYNDLSIISKYNTGIPSYMTDNQLQSLNSKFNELYLAVIDTYYHRNNDKALNIATSYIDQASSVINFHKNRIYEPIGSLASKDASLASSASSAISNVISRYNMFRNGSKYPQSSFASSAYAASDNVSSSKPNNDSSYWQNVANSLSTEMNKKSNADSVAIFAPSSSTETSTSSSTATSTSSIAVTSSSAISSAATSYSNIASSSADPAYTPSYANNSNNSSAKPKNDVYKNFYLSLKKKAAKEVTSNKNRVNKYKKEYKLTKNKQQKAKKLKQYRDAKNKLNASQKHLKSINAKSLKY